MFKCKKDTDLANRQRMETSKKALWLTALLFASTLITGTIFTYLEKDITIFTLSIPATGAVFGATVTFYLNKAKMENVFKGKITFLEYKVKLLKSEPAEVAELIESELTSVDEVLTQQIETTMQEAVSEQITVSDSL